MDEISIRIPAYTSSDAPGNLVEGGGHTIDNCRWRIKTFVERDAYVGYDHASHCLPNSIVTRKHIRLINSKMRARSPLKAWEGFLDKEFKELSRIPVDLDLIDSEDSEVEPALKALEALTNRLSAVKGIKDMAVSKTLHLLRPRFVAISDSYVREELSLNVEPTPSDTYYGSRMLAVQREIRKLRLLNQTELQELSQYANLLSVAVSDSENVPVYLTKVRILDILLWTDFEIRQHNDWSCWSCWYRLKIEGIED